MKVGDLVQWWSGNLFICSWTNGIHCKFFEGGDDELWRVGKGFEVISESR